MASIDAYLALLPAATEESVFLRSVPWVLDVGLQDVEALARDLRDEAARLANLPVRPVFSLLTPLYNTPPRLLRELILSVRCQSYGEWELLLVDDGSPRKDHIETAREWARRDPRIKLIESDTNRGISGARNVAIAHSTGDFLAILDHDDLLHPSALGTYVRILNADPSVNVLFSNECQIDDEGTRTYGYFYKPPFDLFTLLRANYVCHFTAIRRDLIFEARRDGRVFRSEYDGAEDHDLFARVALTGRVKPHHVPLFLYYWRAVPTSCSVSLDAKPQIPERRIALLNDLLPQVYPGASYDMDGPQVSNGQVLMTVKLTAIGRPGRPKLLVVIPFKDDASKLLGTLDALETQDHRLDVTVIIADSGSVEPWTAEALDAWIARPRANRYVVEPMGGPLHMARLLNAAVAKYGAGQDLILSLGHEVEIYSKDALQAMAMQLLADPGCGVVGIKLLAPDWATLRHAGMKVHETTDGSGYARVGPVVLMREFPHDEHVVMGVSLACAMTRADTYARVGGLDEITLTNAHVDVDFCAKAIELGLRNYYFGTLVAIENGPDRVTSPGGAFELATLHERHAPTLAAWRLRTFTHLVESLWPVRPEVVMVTVEVPAAASPLPMRYKVVDRVNAGMKRVLGPMHGVVRSGITGSIKVARSLRRPRAAGESPYRPMFARARKAHAPRD